MVVVVGSDGVCRWSLFVVVDGGGWWWGMAMVMVVVVGPVYCGG